MPAATKLHGQIGNADHRLGTSFSTWVPLPSFLRTQESRPPPPSSLHTPESKAPPPSSLHTPESRPPPPSSLHTPESKGGVPGACIGKHAG